MASKIFRVTFDWRLKGANFGETIFGKGMKTSIAELVLDEFRMLNGQGFAETPCVIVRMHVYCKL